MGIPAIDVTGFPFKIFQTPEEIVIYYEGYGAFRQIHTDGRELPLNPFPAWMGYSTAKWKGDTLVVDTAGFNDKGWMDAWGHPRSEALHVQERFHRRDFGHNGRAGDHQRSQHTDAVDHDKIHGTADPQHRHSGEFLHGG